MASVTIGDVFPAFARTDTTAQFLGGVFLDRFGAKVVNHGRHIAFQTAEVAIPRTLFADIWRLIAELGPPRGTFVAKINTMFAETTVSIFDVIPRRS